MIIIKVKMSRINQYKKLNKKIISEMTIQKKLKFRMEVLKQEKKGNHINLKVGPFTMVNGLVKFKL